jgi:hypothetical protein
MLIIPPYIEAAGVRGMSPTFKTDLMSLNLLADVEISSVDTRTGKSSEQAKLAFSAAVTEWIAWRLDGVVDVSDLLNFAEGLWAAVIDYRYFNEVDHPTPKNKEGGLDHVIFRTWQDANSFIRLCPRGQGRSENCVLLAVLARHVLPKPKQEIFKNWLAVVLERIKTYWAMDLSTKGAEARQGPPVPRAAFDPSLEYTPSMDKKLLGDFVASLDPKTNPYLRSPEEMKKAGFPGTPYKL